MIGSEDKLNNNRISTDDSNINTIINVQSNNDKDQSVQNKKIMHEKRITYFSKPFVNDGNEENSNSSEKNLGNNQSNISLQGQQQPSLDQDKVRARNNLLRQFFPDILKAIGNKAIKDSPPTLKELESYLQNYFNELQKRNVSGENAKDQDDISKSNNPNSSSQENNIKGRDKAHYLKGQDEPAGSVTTVNQKNYRLNFNFNEDTFSGNNLPIVTELIRKGYLVDSDKWLNKKGFLKIGQQILTEIIKSLKTDKIGMHETKFAGYGSMVQETSKKYQVRK